MLTKTERQERDRHVVSLQQATQKMLEKIEKYNAMILAAKAVLEEAEEEYDDVYNAVYGWVEDTHRSHDERIMSRSDAWRDSDKGQEAMEWLDAWSEGQEAMDGDLFGDYEEPQVLDPEKLLKHFEILQDLPSDPG